MSKGAVATTTSVSGARVVVAGSAVHVGVRAGVRGTRHGLEGVRVSINRLGCVHAIAIFVE